MGRDIAKKSARDYATEKENYMRVNLKIRNDSGIPGAIEKLRESGVSANSYILEILKDHLIRDGYLQGGTESK